jgi:bifunctional UDP-N-acetylglucosamine pyrophosphorylase/glucosamine-1-phosphate N-acetyltransferase
MASIRDTVGGEVDYALQDEPRGTADALRAAIEAIDPGVKEIVVLSGDTPLLTPETVMEVLEKRRARASAMALAIMLPADRRGYGRIVRGPGGVVGRIVEEKDATPAERALPEVNGGLYAFDAAWLRSRIGRIKPSPVTGELYLTELVTLATRDGRPAVAAAIPDEYQLTGVNDRLQLAKVDATLRARIVERHLLAGVSMIEPGSVYIDDTVELAPDVLLEPGVILQGATRVGSDTVVGSGSRIVESTVGERCRIWSSVLEFAMVENDVTIGPFAHLRKGASIGAGAELGNFAEVKASRIGPGSKQHHFSYIGDAEVGERVNIGAGTITCNYDGHAKHRTVIGDRSFIGSDTMLVAPVRVGEDSRTGAGAVVTRDVPPGMLAVGVPARMRVPRVREGGSAAAGTAGTAGGAATPAQQAVEPAAASPDEPPSPADNTAGMAGTAGTARSPHDAHPEP